MAFEATKNFKKKSAGGRFEATSNFGVDDTVISSRVNAISRDIESLYNDYYKDYTERSKYVLGVDSKYENMQAPGLKVSMQSYKDRAKKIKQSIEDNKAFLTPEGYLAALQKVNSIIDTDTTEDDKTFSDYFNSSAAAGGRDKFNKIVEERAAAQRVLKKAGLNENSKYRDIKAALSDRTIDAGAAPDEMGQGRRYQGRKLTSEDKDYLSSLLMTEDKVSTMTDDEILRKIKDKGSPSYKQKIAMEEIDRLTKKNEELIKLAEADGNVSSFNPYGDYAEEYADNQQRMEKLRNMVDSDYAGRDVAYYYTDDNGINAMSWENLYYERKVGNAYKAATDKGYGGYNSAAAAAYDEINFIEKVTEAMQWLEQNSTVSAEKKKPYLDIVKEYDEKYGTNYAEEDGIYSIETKNWINSEIKNSDALNKLKENFKSESGATYDAVKDYAKLQRDKERAAKVQETVQTAVEGVNSVPVVGKALGGIASAISAVPFALVSGTDYIFNLMDSIGHSDYNSDSFRPINTYDDYVTNISGEIIGAQTEIYDKAMQEAGVSETARKFWTSTYSGFSSGINSLATVVGSCYAFGPAAGQVVASVILSGQAASSGLQEAVQNGSTTNEALAYGFASGVAEYLGEKISIGSLVDKFLESSFDVTSFKSFMKSFVKDKNLLKMLGQGAVEGSEEVVTEIMNRFSDAVINQDHSKFSNAILTYQAEGLSREEAKKKAFLDVLASAAEQAWGGFVGGIMGGTAAVIGGGVSAARNSVADIKNQIDIGKSITGTDVGSSALKLAEDMGIDTSKASADVKEGKGLGKLRETVQNNSKNKAMGKTVQKVVQKELAEAKTVAMDITQDEDLAEFAAVIATGLADDNAIEILSQMDEDTAEKVLSAAYKAQERSQSKAVRALLTDTEETSVKPYTSRDITGIKKSGTGIKYVTSDGNEVTADEIGLSSREKVLYKNAVSDMSETDAGEMISEYRRHGEDISPDLFAYTWGYYRNLGKTGATKTSERVTQAIKEIYFSEDTVINDALVTAALAQGVKLKAAEMAKSDINARAERIIAKRKGRAEGKVTGIDLVSKNKRGAKTVSRMLAKTGYDIAFVDGDFKVKGQKISESRTNGIYDENTNTIYLRADAEYNATDVKGILGQTLSHEIAHSIKTWNRQGYEQLAEYIRGVLGADMEKLVTNEMKQRGIGYTEALDEVIADGCEMLLRDSKALEKIAMENAPLFVKIGEAISEFVSRLRNAQKAMYEDTDVLHDSALALKQAIGENIEEFQQVFDDVLYDSITNMKNALETAKGKYKAELENNLETLEKQAEKSGELLSVEYTTDNRPVAIIEENILAGVPKSQWVSTVKNTIHEKYSGGIPISGRLIKVNKISRSEFTNSQYTKFLKASDGSIYRDKLKSANNLDDIVLASTNYINEDLKHNRSDNLSEFARGDVLIRVGGNDYSAKVIVGLTSGKQMVLYDVIDFKRTKFDIKKRATQSAMQNAGSERNRVALDKSISDSGENVNSNLKFSQEADEYRELAKNPEKNASSLAELVSRAAKAAGYNSPLLYHGTKNAGFSGFDLSKMDDGSSIFLTSSPDIASTYSGASGTRSIADMRKARSIDAMNAEELTKALNAHSKQNAETDEGIYKYEAYDLKKKEQLTKDVEKGAERLSKTVERLTGEYADRLAEDFDDKTAAVHRQLAELSEKLADGKYSELSTPIYMLLNHTDAFKGETGIAELEKNIRLMNKLNGAKMSSDGVIVRDGLDGYDLRVFSTEQARNELRAAEGAGNYAVYARLGNSLSVDAHGDNWNALDYRVPDGKYEISEEEGQYRIIDKSTRTAVWSDGKMRWDSREQAQKIIDGLSDKDSWTKRLNTTRQIAEYAKAKGYDSVVFKNLRDNGGMNSKVSLDTASDVYVLFNPDDAKSADLVTYDENGDVIPLSERFRDDRTGDEAWKNEDLRFSQETAEYSDYDKPITVSDVEELRSIGRKSINSFTSEDIQKSAKWAHKFYKELGTKSPFFRAWFGDWRAKDSTVVNVVGVPTIDITEAALAKGDYTIDDTSWTVHAGKTLNDDTRHHSGGNRVNVKSLNAIESILKNAVLLDTVVSSTNTNKKSPQTAFLHKLYTPITYNGQSYLAVSTVEEFYNESTNGISRKAYNLKAIKIELAGGQFGINSSSSRPVASSKLRVSDLYSFVKRFDKDFSAGKSVDPVLLNKDGTPKVFYHGSKKNGGFTVFRNWQYFTDKKSYAERYAERGNSKALYAVYLTADKVFDTRDAQARDIYNSIRSEYGLSELQDTGLPDWTDGYDISEYLDEHPELGYDAIILDEGGDLVDGKPISRGLSIVVKDSSQVKSATDNIGTFDSDNGNIYLSQEGSRDTLFSDMEAVAETDEEKSFIERLRGEIKKANSVQAELTDINRQIKEISFTKGSDRSVLPELLEKKQTLEKKLNSLDSKLYAYRGYNTFKELSQRETKDAVTAEKLRSKAALKSQAEKYRDAAAQAKAALEERTEKKRRADIARDIARRIDKIDSIAKADSKTKHIPSALRDIVKAFREQIDSRTQNYDERIARAENAIASLEKRRGKYLDAYTEYTQLAERIKQYDKGSKDYADADARMGQLKQDFNSYNSLTEQIEKKLSSIEKSGERNARAADYLSEMLSYYKTYDNADSTYYIDVSDLARAIEDLRHSIGERPLYLLTADQLEDVLAVTKAVQKKISDANKLFRSSRSVSETTAKVAGETKDARNKKVSRSDFVRGAKDRTANMLYWNNLKPYELFKQSGSDTLYQLYRNLQRAEGDSGRLILKYADKYRETAQKYGIKEKMFNQKFDITFDNGKTARLTGGEILTLYLTAKRGQGRVHLLGDGFRLEGGKMRLVADGKETVYANADMMTLTENDLTKFGKTLSDDMRRFGDEMQKYMSTEIAADGNAVSMKLYDIMLFGEDNYITLTVDNNYLRSTIDPKKNTAKLKNSKFTIKTVANATQALSISSFVNVYQTHASDMAAYAAFTLPLEDITKVINGTSKSEDGSTRVRDVLGSKLYGEMMKFLTEVNGGIRSDGDLAYMRLFSAVKAARTGLNLAVAIQQPCAVMRAFAEINPKYFIGVKAKTMSEAQQRKSLAEMTQYASTWVVKQLGGVDINTKQSIGKTITDLGAKGNTFGHTAAKGLQEGQFWVAEKLDQVTWMWIWNACRNEAIDNFKKSNADYTYKDVLKKAGDRFDEITNKTQVYDSIFARSKIMREGNVFSKFITQFMAEPMTTLNMAYDGIRHLMNGEKGKAAGIFASLIANAIFTAAIRSFADAFRDDDDDKNYWEKYLQALIENSIDNINPFMLLPWFKDIYSLVFNGFNVDRPDVEIIGDLMTKVKKLAKVWGDESKNAEERAEASWDALSILADMSGVAMTSLTRDFRAIYRTITTEWQSATKTTTNTAADTAWKNGLSRNLTTPRDDKGKLYYAFMNDDDTYIARTQDRLGEKDFRRRVIDGLKDNDIRIAEAAAAHMDGDYEKYDSIIRDIANDGFDKEYVVAAVVSAENKALKDSADEDVDTVSQIDGMTATKKDIIADVEEGNYDLLEEYYRLKVDYYKEKEADDPEGKAFTSVRSLLSGHYRDLYKDGDEDERERIADILGDVTVDGHKVIKKSTVRKWKED